MDHVIPIGVGLWRPPINGIGVMRRGGVSCDFMTELPTDMGRLRGSIVPLVTPFVDE